VPPPVAQRADIAVAAAVGVHPLQDTQALTQAVAAGAGPAGRFARPGSGLGADPDGASAVCGRQGVAARPGGLRRRGCGQQKDR
jgi:hypothetical protein